MPRTIEEKINSNREYRRINAEFRALDNSADDDSEKKYIVEGYACTFNEPYELYSGGGYRMMEQITPDAFRGCDTSDVIMQFDHEGRVFARTSNNTLAVFPDEKGLYIRADLSGTERQRDLYEDIRTGLITKMSFGFVVADGGDVWETKQDGDGVITDTRTITAIRKLYDVSAVSIPANDGTEISVRSLVDGVIEKREAERLKAEADKREIEKQKLALRLRLMED